MHLDLKVGESVTIGDANLTVIEKSGQRVRLQVLADKNIKISRLGRVAPSAISGAQECASLPVAKEHTNGKPP